MTKSVLSERLGLLILGFVLGILAFAQAAHAATRDFSVQFTQECLTVSGDDLDIDDDGICEQLTGFRVFTEAGEFISGYPEDGTRIFEFRHNAPWGTQCFKMTSVLTDPIDNSIHESEFSNVGACLDVRPGKPQKPNITN